MTVPDRTELSPALFQLAEVVCIYDRTNGFCHPRNKQGCECWQIAANLMSTTGLSSRALQWVLTHKADIEKMATPTVEAEQCRQCGASIDRPKCALDLPAGDCPRISQRATAAEPQCPNCKPEGPHAPDCTLSGSVVEQQFLGCGCPIGVSSVNCPNSACPREEREP